MSQSLVHQQSKREELNEWLRLIQADSHVLRQRPWLLFQQAANQPDVSAPAIAARECWTAGKGRRPWLQWINKPQSRDRCVMTLTGHDSGVTACAWSPDGKRIVSGSFDWTLMTWDAMTGRQVATWRAHDDTVWACAYSPDGRRIVSASEDRNVCVWDAETGKFLRQMTGPRERWRSCAWSPDGRHVISGSWEGAMTIWDAGTGEALETRLGHTHAIVSCAYSPDGCKIISGSTEHIRVWDVEAQEPVLTLAGHVCAYSPDGRWIVTGLLNGGLTIWNAATGERIVELLSKAGCNWCCFSPDGQYILSASSHLPSRAAQHATLEVWEVSTGNRLSTLRGHGSEITACAYSPCADWIISASHDGTLKLWNGQESTDPDDEPSPSSAHAVAWSPGGRQAISVGGAEVEVWDAETGYRLRTLPGHSVVACGPRGDRMVSATDESTLGVWNFRNGDLLATLKGTSPEVTGGPSSAVEPSGGFGTLRVHSQEVTCCAFTPDGRRIVSASMDGTLRVWDSSTGNEKLVLHAYTPNPKRTLEHFCACSPDGRHMVSWGEAVKVWDLLTGDVVATFAGHQYYVFECAWSPDCRQIVSTSGRLEPVKVWDSRTGQLLAEQSRADRACTFSPDGRRVAASNGIHLMIWDAGTGQMQTELQAAEKKRVTDRVTCCAWSPDGASIASSLQSRLGFWNIQGGVERLVFLGPGEFLHSVFARGGEYIAVCSQLQLYLLRIVGLDSDPPVVTAVRLFNFDRARYDEVLSADCQWCGHRFTPGSRVMEAIQRIALSTKLHPTVSLCLALPAWAWDEPLLMETCPGCQRPLRFNPFIVDNQDGE